MATERGPESEAEYAAFDQIGETLPPVAGDRVRAVRWKVTPGGFDDNRTVPPGTEGTVTGYRANSGGWSDQLEVLWDNGHRLPLLVGEDEYEVI